MDYMQPDYSHGGQDAYYSQQAPYGGGGGGVNYTNTSFDRGSHASLQSAGSNRPRQGLKAGDAGGGKYTIYGSGPHPEDIQRSPVPRSGSPQPSHTHYHHSDPNYHNLSPYKEEFQGYGSHPHSRFPRHDDSYGSRDEYAGDRGSYSNHLDQQDFRDQGYVDNYSDNAYPHGSYRDLPQPGEGYPNDYADNRDIPQSGGPSYDDSYHQSPYHDQDYPLPHNGRMEDDQYSDRHNESLPPRHDESFQGMRTAEQPGHFTQPSYEQDRYPDAAPRQRGSYDGLDRQPQFHGSYDEGQGYQGPVGGDGDPRYRGSYAHEGPHRQYSDPPPDDGAPPSYLDEYDPRDQGQGYNNGPNHEDEARYRGSYQDHPLQDVYNDSQHGLPAVQSDPFADDPFRDQRSHDGSYREDPYNRGPSPSNQGPSPYSVGRSAEPVGDTRPQHLNGPPYDDYHDPRHYPGDADPNYYPEDEMTQRMEAMNVGAPPDTYLKGRRTPSIDGRPPVGGYLRAPDLQEVIDYLTYPEDSVKANAAAYLQHLCYNDDGIKAKTRGLDGIRPLIGLLSHELVEVHKNACGALQNLSFGKTNDENKRAIKNEGGIPELIRLLRKTDQEDVMDSVTGILWNLSSCEDLKQAILEDGLTVLVNVVVLPYSGWSSINSQPSLRPWTTVFRNTTGILRNISSAGYEARKKLRECRGLVNALIHILQLATDSDKNSTTEYINLKPVENVVCTLRNLSYRIQEMEDRDFYKKREQQKPLPGKGGDNGGCFGGGKKMGKKGSPKDSSVQLPPPTLPPSSTEYRALWGNDLMLLYLNVLKTCANPVSIEAAAGAIQNLTACDWAPSVECRAFIRKAKGLPNLVDLLNNDSHRVVCAAATALRNLTIDNTNKELIGKYSIQQLVAWLPKDSRHMANDAPDDLTCAVLATLYEVVRSNQDYAVSLIQEDGLSRLKYINTSDGKYLPRTLKMNHTILKTLWSFKTLHTQYQRLGFTEPDFLISNAKPRIETNRDPRNSKMPPSSNSTTPYNTLSRPISAQGYDDNTLRSGRMPHDDRDRSNYSHHGGSQNYLSMNQSNPGLFDSNDRGNYSRERNSPDSVPMADLGPGPGYAPLDEPRPHKKPVGGVPLFPNLPPGAAQKGSSHQDLSAVPEPLYAQVNKGRRRNDDYARQGASGGIMMEGAGGGQGGADSWV